MRKSKIVYGGVHVLLIALLIFVFTTGVLITPGYAVSWTEDCDSLTGWDTSNDLHGTFTVDSGVYMQGTASIKGSQFVTAGDYIFKNVPVEIRANNFNLSFYWRISSVSTTTGSGFLVKVHADTGTQYMAVCYHTGAGPFTQYYVRAKIGAALNGTAQTLFTQGSGWYYVVVNFQTSSAPLTKISIYVNNTLESTLSKAEEISYPDRIMLHQNLYGTWHVDDIILGTPTYSFSVTIPDLEGNGTVTGDWVFADHKYYNFNCSFNHLNGAENIIEARLLFVTPTFDGLIHNIFTYQKNNFTHPFYYSYNESDAEPCRLAIRESSNVTSPNNTTLLVTFKIWFTKDCLDVYDLTDNVDLYCWANDTLGEVSTWTLTQSNAFKIYVRGGYSYAPTITDYGGNSGKLAGGDVFDLWAWNGSEITVDYIFRHLQHVKMCPQVTSTVGHQTYYIEFQVDYATQRSNNFMTGLRGEMKAESVVYGTQRYFNWTVTWYTRGGGGPGSMSVEKTQCDVVMFHLGSAAGVGENTSTSFWVDLWFNRMNGSMWLCGRINAYQWAMKDNANMWLRWLSTNWGPYDDLQKESSCWTPLYNQTKNYMYAPEIIFVRINATVHVPTAAGATSNQYVTLNNFAPFDLTFADVQAPFIGIQTPTFEETVTPVMPQSGWIGTLWSAINWLGGQLADNVIYGGLSLWPAFVNFMDVIAAWLGYPNGFTNLIAWLGSAWVWLTNSFNYLILLATPFFDLIGGFFSKLVTVIVETVGQWVAMLQITWNFLDGAYTGGLNVFADLNIMGWVTLAVILYPVHLIALFEVNSNLAYAEIRMIWDFTGFLVNIFIRFIQLVLAVIGRIIESIPVVE